jgi:hypothetical protein
VRRGAGTETSIYVPFTSSGTVEVQEGSLYVSGATTSQSGTWVVAGGSTLKLAGPNSTFDATSVLRGAGAVEFQGTTTLEMPVTTTGNVTVTGTTNLNNSVTHSGAWRLTGGTLGGAGDVTLTGSLEWTSGTMSGAGRTVLSSGTTATLTPTSIPLYLSRELSLGGTSTLNESTNGYGLYLTNGVLRNTGTLTATNRAVVASSGGTNEVINSGTLVRRGAGTETSIYVPFTSSGTVEVREGTLALSNGSRFEAGSSVSGAGTLALSGGTHTFAVRAANQFGRVNNPAGTVTLAGTLAASIDPAYVPVVGDTFPIVRAGTVTGTFSNTLDLPLTGGLRLRSRNEPGGGVTLFVTTP